jgi:hypothetical protein
LLQTLRAFLESKRRFLEAFYCFLLQKLLARLKLLLIREQNGPGGEVILTRSHHNYLSCVRKLKVRHITYNLRYVTDVLNYKLT